jgi:PAS domain S-box-containing protein
MTTPRDQHGMFQQPDLFRTLLDHTTDAIEVVDPETLRLLDVNQTACVQLGYSREEMLSMSVFDLDPNLNEGFRTRVARQLQESGFAMFETERRRKDGSTFPVEVTYRKVQREREYGVAVTRDITARKRSEEALRESELRFRTLYERSPAGIILVDSSTGRFLQVNQKFCEITGRTEDELLRSDVESLSHPDDLGRGSQYLGRPPEDQLAEYEMERRYLRPDGSVCWVSVLVVPLWNRGEKHRCHLAMVKDITERKQMQETICTLVQVRASSSDNFFLSMAIELARCLGADGTIIGELIEGKIDRVKTLAVCSQGMIADNFVYDLADTPCEGVLRQHVCSYVFGVAEMFPKDLLLKEMTVEGYVGAPLRDSRGRVVGIMVAIYNRALSDAKFAEGVLQLFSTRTAAEIERKRAEEALRGAQTELAHVTRVLAIGELVTSIAHEVNQPLTAILTTSNVVRREMQGRMPNLEEIQQAVTEIAEDAVRIKDIISRVRALVKKDFSERVELNVNHVIREAALVVSHEAARNDVHVRLDLGINLPGVVGDRVQLQQVIINLAMNGIDAMHGDMGRARELVIKSEMCGDGVLIQVRDTGVGLNADQAERIFQSFFTTKPQGIGMGLSISRSIIESHGGRLWAEPVSQGAIFQITLPANLSGQPDTPRPHL